MKLFKKSQYCVLALFIVGAVSMKKFGLPPYYETEKSTLQVLSALDYKMHTNQQDGLNSRFIASAIVDKPVLVFIHGSPGAWTAWSDYLVDEDLQQHYSMMAIDRIGFGGSDNGTHEENLEKQASFIMQALAQSFEIKERITVVGHSYGGPVALRLAVDYPDIVGAIGLLAPSVSPALEKPQWYNKLAAHQLIRKIIPKAVDRSNQEILPLKSELLKMAPYLPQIKVPVFVVHGKADKLVPAANASFAKEALSNADVDVHLIPDRGHFIPWQEYELVKSLILNQKN